MDRKSLCGLTIDEIIHLTGTDLHHATVIANCIYKKKITDIDKFPGISKPFKQYLRQEFYPGLFEPIECRQSSDGSKKYLFRNEIGLEFETVYLPDGKRNTVCVSTQSGCKMNCTFCVTGKSGFHGDLSIRDILNQVIRIPGSDIVTHVVFMGMGEPMDNLDNVINACKILSAEWGLAISRRNITVSTVGIMPGIKKFLQLSECNLTFSLYSPFAEERQKVIPVENNYPASEIIGLLKNFPARNKQRFSVAYVMINGVNDTDKHLEGLKALFHDSHIRVNLIRYHSDHNDVKIAATPEKMQYFKHELITSGISASIRKSRGEDISAACGLLAAGLRKKNSILPS